MDLQPERTGRARTNWYRTSSSRAPRRRFGKVEFRVQVHRTYTLGLSRRAPAGRVCDSSPLSSSSASRRKSACVGRRAGPARPCAASPSLLGPCVMRRLRGDAAAPPARAAFPSIALHKGGLCQPIGPYLCSKLQGLYVASWRHKDCRHHSFAAPQPLHTCRKHIPVCGLLLLGPLRRPRSTWSLDTACSPGGAGLRHGRACVAAPRGKGVGRRARTAVLEVLSGLQANSPLCHHQADRPRTGTLSDQHPTCPSAGRRTAPIVHALAKQGSCRSRILADMRNVGIIAGLAQADCASLPHPPTLVTAKQP